MQVDMQQPMTLVASRELYHLRMGVLAVCGEDAAKFPPHTPPAHRRLYEQLHQQFTLSRACPIANIWNSCMV